MLRWCSLSSKGNVSIPKGLTRPREWLNASGVFRSVILKGFFHLRLFAIAWSEDCRTREALSVNRPQCMFASVCSTVLILWSLKSRCFFAIANSVCIFILKVLILLWPCTTFASAEWSRHFKLKYGPKMYIHIYFSSAFSLICQYFARSLSNGCRVHRRTRRSP